MTADDEELAFELRRGFQAGLSFRADGMDFPPISGPLEINKSPAFLKGTSKQSGAQ
jgi:hypothetical protein